jgi:hypothetical protein
MLKKYIKNSLSIWKYAKDFKSNFSFTILIITEKIAFCVLAFALLLCPFVIYDSFTRFYYFNKNFGSIHESQIIISGISEGGFKRPSYIRGYMNNNFKQELNVDIFKNQGLLDDVEIKVIKDIFTHNRINDTLAIWYTEKNNYSLVKFQNTKKELYHFEWRFLLYNVRYLFLTIVVSLFFQIILQKNRYKIETKTK